MNTYTPRLTLKWGTIKGWEHLTEPMQDTLQAWINSGVRMSAMMQHNSPEQIEAICHLLDVTAEGGGVIWNDWDGRGMTADEAKRYVREYRQ